MIFKSIRWRFVLWLAFLLVCVLSGFGFTAYQLHRTNRFGQLDEELKRRVATLSSTRRAPQMPGNRGDRPRDGDWKPGPPPDDNFGGPRRFGGPPGPPPDFESKDGPMSHDFRITDEVASLFEGTTTNDFYYATWLRNGGGLLGISTNVPINLSQPDKPGKDTGTFFRNHAGYREAFHYTERGDCILVGRSIFAEVEASHRFLIWLVAGGVAVLAFGIGGVWLLAGRALAPVQTISAAASRISEGNLSERINVSQTDNELGQLANTLNTTFARLETSFAQQKQFTADASHELRTPLAVLISEAQTTLTRERTAPEYRETIEACLETAQQMRKLTDSLMQLARFDSGQETIRRDAVDLADVARDCVKLLHPLADRRGLRIVCELSPANALADAELLKRVVSNLVSNAIQYNKPGGELRIATKLTGDMPTLTVADTGTGIAPTDLPHIFERFYRADKSRTRSNGNSGLGLSICKAIVDAHNGSIEVTSRVDEGTQFTVRLPASTMTDTKTKNGDPLPDRRS